MNPILPENTPSNPSASGVEPGAQPGAGENPVPPAADALNHAMQGAQNGVEQFADRATSVKKHLGESVASAKEAVQEKTGQLRDAGEEWMEDMRDTVRGRPLLFVGLALVLGAWLARKR